MDKSVRSKIENKRRVYQQSDSTDLSKQAATRELKIEILQARKNYKVRLESQMAANKLGSAWSSMKSIIGQNSSKHDNLITLGGYNSDLELANALNGFYNRFDTFAFSGEIQDLRHNLEDSQHFCINQRDVERAFLSVKVNKSCGPDNICGRVLKFCAKELSPVFHHIFNMSLRVQHVPSVWKDAMIVPVPKVSCPKILNDFRPVALTSVLMKILERFVKCEILRTSECLLDPMQFAYRSKRGVEDATVTLIHLLMKHLEGKGTHARVLFVDFSSAFNTIQPHVLVNRLAEQFKLSNNLGGWILDFLTNRTQRVRIKNSLSVQVTSSTGSPQGCVLSPLLFILYTNMCQSNWENRVILKYADDTVIVSLLKNGETGHGPVITDFVEWCEESQLHLNVLKTKDMVIDFRRNVNTHEVTTIKGQAVECVQSYKYLGTIIDSKLSFEGNCEAVCKKGHQRMFFLRKLCKFHIDKTLLILFYRAYIESVLSFTLVSWYGNLSVKNRNSMNQIVKWASKLIGEPLLTPALLYTRQVQRMGVSVTGDRHHPLYNEFQLLPSNRRYRVPHCTTKRFKNSFVPAVINHMNKLKA